MGLRIGSYLLLFDSVGIPFQNMPDLFALEKYPYNILILSQRTSFAHSASPFNSEWKFTTFTEKNQSLFQKQACTHTSTYAC